MGASFGAGAGLLATGLVLGYFTAHPLTLPWLGLLQPWQTTLMSIGLPGLLVLVLMIGVPEPRLRKNAMGLSPTVRVEIPLREVLAYLRENRRTFTAIFLGAGCFYTAVYGSGSWVPTYFVREFGWSYARIGALMGAIMCVFIFGMIGNTAVGMLYSFLARLLPAGTRSFRLGAVAAGVAAFICSLIGFISLVGQVYPLFGYLGFLLIAAVLIGWLRLGRLAGATS